MIMNIEKIQAYINPKTTGYTAIAGLGLTAASAYGKNKYIKKAHKPFAFITALAAIVHVGQIEYYKHKFKTKN